MTPITFQALRKTFGPTVAVDDVSLTIPAGSLFFLLGPSGCGKTTLLRMIAGFTEPTAGRLLFGDTDITHLPANRRNAGMVFQGYALWPHMTVAQNVAFGLEVRKLGRADIQRRVAETLAQVQLDALAGRKINQLSGGQQQRVALARALVIRPTVLLLDEPLSNLDASLRIAMRSSIRQICKDAGITAVYVTHDQKEALSMADGVAVMRHGRVIQAGPPRDLYHRPAYRFVASFLGETNLLTAQIEATDSAGVRLATPAGPLWADTLPPGRRVGESVLCAVRPEAMHLFSHREAGAPGQGVNRFPATLLTTTFLGEIAQHQLQLGTGTQAPVMQAFELNPRQPLATTNPLTVHIAPQDVIILQDERPASEPI